MFVHINKIRGHTPAALLSTSPPITFLFLFLLHNTCSDLYLIKTTYTGHDLIAFSVPIGQRLHFSSEQIRLAT
ncbi:MAG: hypothetical protein UT41_C0001G0512 [Candidatus Wolfebacteria bacterium GW2011_GWC2_39_22]|uniref:Uncharacterized protein n=2 Tax=Candidatus Wolfeibacteriota TaxID=1752735 RepID=A0A0G1HAS4_9BACT|nr:MAG: hypothetical protein UT41_C0001G0512 [Candidatus Wolfebacteria bacterium GW2011_GWC2_39_22]KKT43895.1 MAG: hypothetical protein UW32_C0001G0487 [Candidatus Wolfebacteria bacterium GW2011_GWE2_44_13]